MIIEIDETKIPKELLVEVDGKRVDAAYVPVEMIKDGSSIVVHMGADAKTYEAERV